MSDQSSIPRFQNLRVISALMVREMITRYGRSWGGYFWAVAEPVGMIALLSVAFSAFLRSPPLGSSFIVFYASGYIVFSFYQTINASTSSAVSGNRSLMKFPMVSPLDAIIARAVLQFLTMIVVTLIVIAGLQVLSPDPVRVSLWPFMLACLSGSVIGLGGGTLNVVLFSFFPFYRNLWAIISRPLFIVSGIFYTVESMPSNVQFILLLNPLVHVTGQSHKAFYSLYDGAFVNLWYPTGLGVAMFLVGAALINRHRSFIIENA